MPLTRNQTTLYALIMAGGTGSRLWPRSRFFHPKQFLDLTGDLTMLQMAQQRLEPLVMPEHTLVVTNRDYVDIVATQLPALPPANILGEPVGRGTAAAIGLAAIHLRQRDPAALMAVLTADHLIKKTGAFRAVLAAAAEVAAQGWLVTLGIQPGYPETGYGYIERGAPLPAVDEFEVYQVARFVEKPDLMHAEGYVQSGKYAWNSGMFIWRVDRILDEMARHMPEMYALLTEIERSIGAPDAQEVFDRVFPAIPNQTIDFGIMEKADQVAVLPVEIGWNDVGSWSAVYDVLPRDEQSNAVVGRHLTPDSKNSLIYSPKRLVATIGLEDMVVVDTDDVLLICPRARSQDVKWLVTQLQTLGETGYLQGNTALQASLFTPAEVSHLFDTASLAERVLLSLIFHAGLPAETIAHLTGDDFDLLHGWITIPEGRRPLADRTREAVFAWMREQDTLQIAFAEHWKTPAEVEKAGRALGERAGLHFSIERAHATLARALFETSEEGQVLQNVLGVESSLVQVPLHAQFPFSLTDFDGNERTPLGDRARAALNRAVASLHGER